MRTVSDPINPIEARFSELKRRGNKAFIAYLTGGDPNLATTEKLIVELDRRGADVIEIGVPFSDPLADGATIQAASERALARGATLAKLLALSKRLKGKISAPLVFMSYFNPIYRYGCERFAIEARDSGVSGVIVPDLPPEEAGELEAPARAAGLHMVYLLAPTSTRERIAVVAAHASGFIYCVSLTGVTGARQELPAALPAFTAFESICAGMTSEIFCLRRMTSPPNGVSEIGVTAGARLYFCCLPKSRCPNPFSNFRAFRFTVTISSSKFRRVV